MGPFTKAVFSSKELFDENDLEHMSTLDPEKRLAFVHSRANENIKCAFSEFYANICDNDKDKVDDNQNLDSTPEVYKVN
jgi:hypothetical protein